MTEMTENACWCAYIPTGCEHSTRARYSTQLNSTCPPTSRRTSSILLSSFTDLPGIRLPPAVQARIVLNMDFSSLMMFRTTSHSNFSLVRDELTKSLDDILHAFVPDPARFRQALMESDTFLGGDCALRFFLRLPPHPDGCLDIFTSSDTFPDIICQLLSHQSGVPLVPDLPTVSIQGVGFYLVMRTDRACVTVFRSRGHALLPICHAPSSSLAAYVNPRYFGLVWPKLTLNRRAMPSELSSRSSGWAQALRDQLDVDSKLWPWMWPDMGISRQQCARQKFMCPAQERLFIDDGSLHGSIDPWTTVPLDPRIAFRLSSRRCRRGCHGAQTRITSFLSVVVEY